MGNYKLIPFDISKAKTPQNPNGLEVVTKHNIPVTIVFTDYKGEHSLFPILAVVHEMGSDETEIYNEDGLCLRHSNGNDYNVPDLRLKESIQQRRMTNRELSMWLRLKPEEMREKGIYNADSESYTVHSSHWYESWEENEEVGERIKIRTNFGDWHEPLVDAN